MSLKSLHTAKAQARALREGLATQGTAISHSQALELVARQNGARDWNTLQARLAKAEPTPLQIDAEVRGQYLGQDFTGRIVGLTRVGRHFQVSLQLNAPVDVVQFESFSSLRHHIRGTIGADGKSPQKTSNGAPHLVITLPS
ncbi:hypothetical protein J4E08_22035 [Sagittula sp. NFXS13]|uniref:glyoxalase superfamily protein n=1 Tax=Sagittula sp. NFXS13 TaxID=2819095 RepID=UPI0032DF8E39